MEIAMREHGTAFEHLVADGRTEPAFGATVAPIPQHEAELFLPHMRGACLTIGKTVHTLFRLSGAPGVRTSPARTPEIEQRGSTLSARAKPSANE